jgi:hypothetical protein
LVFELLRGVVDHHIGPEPLDKPPAARRGCCRHLRAEPLRQLDGESAHAARPARYEYAASHLHIEFVTQRLKCREPCERNARSGVEIQRRGHPGQEIFRDNCIFGERSHCALGHAGKDPLSLRELRCAFAALLHYARQLVAHDGRQGIALDHPECAFARLEIDRVEARCVNAHQNLSRRRARPRYLTQFSGLGPTVSCQNERQHLHECPMAILYLCGWQESRLLDAFMRSGGWVPETSHLLVQQS